MKKLIFLSVFLLLSLAGCLDTVSLYPLFDEEKQLEFEPRLIGKWDDPGNDCYWNVIKVSEFNENDKSKAYLILIQPYDSLKNVIDNSDSILVLGLYGKIGSHYFLNTSFASYKAANKLNDFFLKHLINGNKFFKVSIAADSIFLSSPDFKWLDDNKKKKSIKPLFSKSYHFSNKEIFIAEPKALRDFTKKYADNDEVFKEWKALVRVK